MSLSGSRDVKFITGDVNDFKERFPVAEIQFGEVRGDDAYPAKPVVIHPAGRAGAATPSKFSEYGNEEICEYTGIAVNINMKKNGEHERNCMEILPLVMFS